MAKARDLDDMANLEPLGGGVFSRSLQGQSLFTEISGGGEVSHDPSLNAFRCSSWSTFTDNVLML